MFHPAHDSCDGTHHAAMTQHVKLLQVTTRGFTKEEYRNSMKLNRSIRQLHCSGFHQGLDWLHQA